MSVRKNHGNAKPDKVAVPPAATSAIEAREELLLAAVTAFQANEMTRAEELSRTLIGESPGFAPGKLLIGMILGKTGRRRLAIDTLREAITIDPDYMEPWIVLAGYLNEEQDSAASIVLCEDALQRWPDNAGLYNVLGLALMNSGQAAEAAGTLQRAIALDPSQALIHYNLGMAQQAAGRDLEAIAAYGRAISIDPALVEAHAQLAHLLFAHGRRNEARESLRQGNLAQPNTVGGRLLGAELAVGEGRLDDAEVLVLAAIADEPASAPAHHLLAILQQQAGRFAEARASYETTAALSPHRTSALIGLALSRKFVATDQKLLDRLLDLAQSSAIPDVSRADVHYALGKAFDDLADYEQAMWHFDAANVIVADRVARNGMGFDRQQHIASIDMMIERFSGDFFRQRVSLGYGDDLPVLIVGMPRSGTTLVEQIITSHPDIGAGGEQHFWPEHSAMLAAVMDDRVPASELWRISEAYCATLRALAADARQMTDKMPANFLLLGLIHLALPNARIIHCRRDPVDTCLSIYTTPFSNLVNFAHQRDDIVVYYRAYAKLMAHWRRVLPPNRLIEIDYEQLVANQETETRRLISFCGLPWHDACLRHEQNPHIIHTPSWWQARQPVYRTSVDRWRRYEPWLGSFGQLQGDGGTEP